MEEGMVTSDEGTLEAVGGELVAVTPARARRIVIRSAVGGGAPDSSATSSAPEIKVPVPPTEERIIRFVASPEGILDDITRTTAHLQLMNKSAVWQLFQASAAARAFQDTMLAQMSSTVEPVVRCLQTSTSLTASRHMQLLNESVATQLSQAACMPIRALQATVTAQMPSLVNPVLRQASAGLTGSLAAIADAASPPTWWKPPLIPDLSRLPDLGRTLLVHRIQTIAATFGDIPELLSQCAALTWSGIGIIRRLAAQAYAAALHARDAVLHGDSGPVVAFMREWLGIDHPSDKRIEALSEALLEEGWDTAAPMFAGELTGDLKARAYRHAHVLKPAWETTLHGRPVAMLGEEVTLPGGSLCTLGDLVRDPWTAEDIAIMSPAFADPRLCMITSQLSPADRRLVEIYAEGGRTWPQAAAALGHHDPDKTAERVRRRVRRLAQEAQRRQGIQISRRDVR